jgi:hypothetical protein
MRRPALVVLARIPRDARGLRDRALIFIGWAAALRRSELAALGGSDLQFEPDGLTIELRRSKDGSGGCRRVCRGSVWRGAGDVSCARCARMAGGDRRRWRGLSADRPTWQHRLEPDGNGNRVDHSPRERRRPGSPVISPVTRCAPVLRRPQRMPAEARQLSCGMVDGKAFRLRVAILVTVCSGLATPSPVWDFDDCVIERRGGRRLLESVSLPDEACGASA